ncbi:ATP-binding protein [Nocardiopsis halotolerans]|uniref:ATP-binding protein n=1 Tax=Nocardiopsis halotolerans TaxID=124252 RepID=UPI00034B8B37
MRGSALPQRVSGGRPGVRVAIFGPLPSQVRQMRAWCRKGVPVDPLRALRVEVVASELVTNALTHSASGRAGGHVRVEMERLTSRLLRIAVTDDGPWPGQEARFPCLAGEEDALAVCGRGLRLVEQLSTSWGWEGEPGRPLTVWANLDPYAPVLAPVDA